MVEVIHDDDDQNDDYDNDHDDDQNDNVEFEGLPSVRTISITKSNGIRNVMEAKNEYSSRENLKLEIEPLTHSERRVMSKLLPGHYGTKQPM